MQERSQGSQQFFPEGVWCGSPGAGWCDVLPVTEAAAAVAGGGAAAAAALFVMRCFRPLRCPSGGNGRALYEEQVVMLGSPAPRGEIFSFQSRYIQDPNKIPETLDNDVTQNLLTKAVETCFVGQSFIFGVTNFEIQHGQGSNFSDFLQQCPNHKREVKALVACQILLPNPGVAGFTVIDYFNQLLQKTSTFRKLHYGSQVPNSHLLALDHSNSDLSSLCSSDSSFYFFESCSRDNFSRFWQPSLELTSSVSQVTDNDDLKTSEQSKAFGNLHQNKKYLSIGETTGSSNYHDSIQGSWNLVSCMDKKSTAEKLGEEIGLPANQLSAVHSSHHEIGVTDSELFPLKIEQLLELSNTKSIHSAVEIKSRSQHELPCSRHCVVDTPTGLQERVACCPLSSLRDEKIAGSSQEGDPMIWDDLPFSESLNKFLAVIDSEIAVTQTDASNGKHHIVNNSDNLHEDHSRLSVTPQRTTRALHISSVAVRSSHATLKANSSQHNFLFNCKANPSPSVRKRLQPDNTADTVSSSRRDILEHFPPNASLSTLFSLSKGLETAVTLKTIRTPPHKERDHTCFNIKYFNGCGEKSLSEMNERLTTLCCRKYNDVSHLCKLEDKQNYRWPKSQDNSFTICRKLTYPLETLCSSPNRDTNTVKEISYGHINSSLAQSCSDAHEGSYDASVDLFGDVAKEMDITTEITQWLMSLAESHPSGSDFSLRSLSENSSQPSEKLSLQSISASACPRTCSPPSHFQSDLEYNFENSQDFVPCSQSTPIAGFHQTRIHSINGAFKRLPAFCSDLDANYKKASISPENDKQQATPSCPKNIKTANWKSTSPVISGITQTKVFNHYPFAECHETDSDEWVPPTTQKAVLSNMLGLQLTSLRRCLAAHNSPDQQELPRKKLKHIKQRTYKCFIKKKQKIVTKHKTLKYNCKNSGWVSNCPAAQVLAAPLLNPVLELESCSEVKCCLPFSANSPPSVSETKSAWSPELFS
ncbi:DNA damage-induced apoptosis suppressor protein [Carlito syrichta]|uniref:DNA damage-induced apoptosis suppressor protein n=1 Tax=Carlito syrichta TaxID=1868482 RepID=A0A3Q0E2K4_CARSF|nr:DNA damage-induced apoptosis suppressor protein [Carlito syrichta]